ncbi:hybrid sensor histidine kinase/response regulator [Hahella ganghwensis]|uniref:hybrid sensor histidine kinase/response regulator n=1 Tax=Hahella ganghwensis TaxID=286420 RepID=UPI000379A813|nr:response regulator [Hahella ganghwensis]
MTSSQDALRKRLLLAFSAEAKERLASLADKLAMAQLPLDHTLIEEVYREVHSLKGASRAVSLGNVEKLCQSWENLLGSFKSGKWEITQQHLELCRQAETLLRQLVKQVDQPPPSILDRFCSELESGQLPSIQASLHTPVEAPASDKLMEAGLPSSSPTQDQPLPSSDAINGIERRLKVNAASLDTLLFYIEDLQQAKLDAAQNRLQLEEAANGFANWRRHRHEVAVASRQIKQRQERHEYPISPEQQVLLDFSDWVIDYLGQWEYRLNILAQNTVQLTKDISMTSDALQQEMQNVLLLPCNVLVEGIPVMVNEIARHAGKKISLVVKGDSLTVDKRILDELKSPLQHLVRNAIDHGVESPSVRQQAGKPETGILTIEFLQEQAASFVLKVRDDGRGLDLEKIKVKAVKQHLIEETEAATLPEREIQQLIFASGLSTSAMITDISGRGLGLAIVREKVEQIGGHIEMGSPPEGGTEFSLQLPVSMATFRALLVRASESLVAIPAQAVIRAHRFTLESIKTIENHMTVSVDGSVLPFWRLAEVLQLEEDIEHQLDTSNTRLKAVQMFAAGESFCLQVDEIIGDQEMIVKPLGPQLVRVPNVLGATQLGDGTIVPVLNPQDLYRSACETGPSQFTVKSSVTTEQRHKILVAEDSITSRGLMKTILENAGYEVRTANDGMEAWTQLRQNEFDLLVSDIEMPHMDGFTLTEKVRRYRSLSGLPVVLVTALQSPEDQERGLEAGANAYILKSSFDQVNLLTTIRQLL